MRFPAITHPVPAISRFRKLSTKRKATVAGTAAAAALVLTVTGLEATAGAGAASAAAGSTAARTTAAASHTAPSGHTAGFTVSTGEHVKTIGAKTGMASQSDIKAAQLKVDLTDTAKKSADAKAVKAADVAKAAKADAAKKQAAAAVAKKDVAKKDKAKAAAAAAKKAQEKAAAASRAAHRAELKAKAVHRAPVKTYANDLDGWIRHSLDIMHAKGIPGSYSGIHRNIIRESSGNPKAINLWDINARNGIPSKGLLQVINPTFQRYHVAGTSWNIYNPVANITAACNYAADRYGSMDNVNSAY